MTTPGIADGSSAIDARTFWRLMGLRPVGAAVVTACHEGRPAGLLALSATHVAASPPTMLVSVARSTSALPTIRAAGRFAISYLPADAQAVADAFGGRTGLAGADRFSVGRWSPVASWDPHTPVLEGAVLALGCRVEAVFATGETEIIVGRIEHHHGDDATAPLVAYRGGYQPMARPAAGPAGAAGEGRAP